MLIGNKNINNKKRKHYDYHNNLIEFTPYIRDLLNYVNSNILPFQCPGHKAGNSYLPFFKNILKKHLFKLETNEIPIIDTFQNPSKGLKESQQRVANLYGVYKTFFIVGGSTLSNVIALSSLSNENGEILIPRNAHKSVFSGLIISGVKPYFIYPEYDYNFNIDHNLSIDKVIDNVKKLKLRQVLISNPTYYGSAIDIEKLSLKLREIDKNIILIVDQAWGAHFKFNPNFPKCSTDYADIIIMSPHKTLSAFTQSSFFHIGKSLLIKKPEIIPKIEQTVLMLSTTSPNSLLLFSMDYTQFELNNPKIFQKLYSISSFIEREIKKIDEDIILTFDKLKGNPGVDYRDITKIVINMSKYGLSGYELEEILLNNYKIQVELADLFNVVFLITVGDSYKKAKYLVNAIKDVVYLLKKGIIKPKNILRKIKELPDWPKFAITPRQAFISKYRYVNLEDSVGLISSELITTYPPGIPIIIPGEIITKDIVEHIKNEIKFGGKITGFSDKSLKKIRVVDQ
ncbi:MAG: aminotransferase class I/II-fold pyridoxal phosphate-dependent enzyme [bacterium]